MKQLHLPAYLNSIFSFMKKIVSLLFILFSFSLLHSQSYNDTISLGEYEVISAANPVEFRQISKTVHVISSEQIKKAPVVSVDEILKFYGGIDIRSRGAMGVQSDINLRGGTFDQGLIMVDGISLNDPQTGHHNLNQAIDLDDIEKIEIFEGPGARWFGNNSFSGGINIISKKPDNNSLSVSLSGGQYGYFAGRLGLGYKIGQLKNRTSVGLRRSDGYINNTDFNIINLNHNSYYEFKKGSLDIGFGLLDKGFGANSFYTPKYPNQYEKIRTYFTSATYETGTKVKFRTNAYWRRNLDRFELFREDESWYVKQGDYYIHEGDTAGYPTPGGLYPYQGHNYHRTDIIGANAGINFSSIIGKSSIGVSVKSETIVSNVLGEPMTDTIFIGGSDGFYNKSKSRNTVNLSLNQFYSKNNFSVSAGLSVFYNDDYGLHFSPGIDLGYFISNKLKVYASVNHSLRLPTFTDLYYQGPTNISNPDLKPETSLSSEIGFKYLADNFNISIAGFYRMGDNIIDWVKYSPEQKWQSANLSSMNTYGISFSTNYQFKSGPFNYAGLKYSWLNSEKQNTDIISLYALDFLKHNFNVFVNHSIIKNLSASWTFTVQNRNGSYIDYATENETPYQTVGLLNLKLLYAYKNLEFSITGSNLLNNTYYDIGNVQQPGLWLIGGVKLSLER